MTEASRWKVSYSGKVRRQVKALILRALAQGIHAKVAQAIKNIDYTLHTQPQTFGEEMYQLRALKLQVRVGTEQPLFVRYTVHENLPLVFVITIEGLGKSGLV